MKCRNCKHNGFLTDEDGTQFSWCDVVNDNLDIDEERKCMAFKQASNADRIRAMSDEDLAEFIAFHDMCPEGREAGDENCKQSKGCDKCWLKWLKKEDV